MTEEEINRGVLLSDKLYSNLIKVIRECAVEAESDPQYKDINIAACVATAITTTMAHHLCAAHNKPLQATRYLFGQIEDMILEYLDKGK